MGTSEAPVSPTGVEPGMGFVERLLGVFISPGETFADVARKPGFIAPLVLVIVISAGATEAFLAKIGLEPVVRWGMEHGGRTANMTPEQMDQTIAKLLPIQSVLARVFEVIGIPLVTLIVAAIGLGILTLIFGVKINFKTAFSVAAYAYVVNIIYYAIALVMTFLGDPEHIISNPQSPTPSSVGFFLNPLTTSKFLVALGSSLEVFTFWYLALLGIGFSEASGKKVKAAPVFFIFFGLWVIGVLIKSGLASLG